MKIPPLESFTAITFAPAFSKSIAATEPAKLMGIESQGMLLAAVKDEKLTIITTLDEIDSGSQ